MFGCIPCKPDRYPFCPFDPSFVVASKTYTMAASRAKVWFIYLLECVDGSIYTGIAIDVEARFAAHAAGKGARYTRAHPPLRLLASAVFPDRATASQEEYRIKQMTPAAKRAYADMLAARQGEDASASLGPSTQTAHAKES